MERLVRELVEPLLLGRAQGGVLHHERALERELLDELALLVGPVPRRRGVAAEHEAERALLGQQREGDIGLQPQRLDQLRRASGGWRRRSRRRSASRRRAATRHRRKSSAAGRHDVLAQRTLEVTVRAHRLQVPDPVVLVAHQQRGLLGLERLLGHARERLAGLLRPTRRAIPPGAAGGSRWRRAGVRCARRSCAPARSSGAMCAAAAATSRTSSAEKLSGCGSSTTSTPTARGGLPIATAISDSIPKVSAHQPATSGDFDEPVTTGSPEWSAASAARQHRGGARASAPTRSGHASRRRTARPPASSRPSSTRKHGCPPCADHRRHALAERGEHLVQGAGGERGLRQPEQELGLGALAVALDRAGDAADRGGHEGEQGVQLGRRPGAAGSIESIPTARPASSGSKRAEPIASSAASSAGTRSSACASGISIGRASSSTLTADGNLVERDLGPLADHVVDRAGRVDGVGDHDLPRRVVEPHDHTLRVRRPRARPCRGGRPTRRPPAAIQLACPQKSARHGFRPAPCAPDAAARAMLSTSVVPRAGAATRIRALDAVPRGGQAVEERLRSSPPAGSPPRYSGRFLIPSRVDHFE